VISTAIRSLSYDRRSSGNFAMSAVKRQDSSCVNQMCGRSPARLLLEIDVGERVPAVVPDDEAGVRFLRNCVAVSQSLNRLRRGARQQHCVAPTFDSPPCI
jgi:hypothetical protein